MADAKLSALTLGTAADYYYGIQGSNSRKFNSLQILNIKDFGNGLGSGGNATAAFQAAITAAYSAGYTSSPFNAFPGAAIYFPPGAYVIDQEITFTGGNASIHLLGGGRRSTMIYGDFDGWLINKADGAENLGVIEGLYFKNANTSSTSGCIKANQMEKGIMNNLYIDGYNGIECTENTYGIRLSNIDFACSQANRPSGGIGINGAQLNIQSCRGTGWDIAFNIYGIGSHIHGGCSVESCNTAVRIGRKRNGDELTCSAFKIDTFQTERCEVGIDGYSMAEGTFDSILLSGTVGPAHAISTISWSGGTAEVTVSGATLDSYGWTSGTKTIKIEAQAPYNTNYATGFVTGTRTSTTTFTYAIASDPGAFSGGTTWSFRPLHGFRQRGGNLIVYKSCVAGISNLEGYGFDLAYGGGNVTSGNNTTFINCSGTWGEPENNQKPTFQYINCPSRHPLLLYAELPGESGNVYPGAAIEGMEYDISNCDHLNFGMIANGSGSNHVKVRYDGTNWRVISGMNGITTVANLPASPVEGMEWNVTDGTDSLAWGATVTNTGSHTTHYKVRYNGSNWTVVGK